MSKIKMEQNEENFKKEFTAVSERIEKSHEMIRKAINNAPSMSFEELERFPVLQVKIFEYVYWDGPDSDRRDKSEESLNRNMRTFLLENNITRDKIVDFKVGIENSNRVSVGKVQPALCLRAILTYWQD